MIVFESNQKNRKADDKQNNNPLFVKNKIHRFEIVADIYRKKQKKEGKKKKIKIAPMRER